MLQPEQITTMRDVTRAALPETATISRKTAVSDGAGGRTETWADIATAVPCRVGPAAGGETGMSGGRIEDESTHVVTFSAGQDITEADRLTVAGQSYEVTLVRRRGAWETSRRAEVRETA